MIFHAVRGSAGRTISQNERHRMSGSKGEQLITKERYDAVLFDLDGVITATAKVHAACWKEMFDEFLKKRADRTDDPFVPFDIVSDYKKYVDGKLRYDGVESFLESRGIQLPYGDPDAAPNYESVCGLGNFKDSLVKKAFRSGGVEVYEGTIALVHHLLRLGVRTAVVSASNNCKMVLDSASIVNLFEVRVDGHVATELNLPGKPEPDSYLEASRRLGVDPARAVVMEDAISGVRAGKAGGFGLVVGVDRKGFPEELLNNGADIVVGDPGELLP
jgi:beta-phosphoglucomutase family hydrolase